VVQQDLQLLVVGGLAACGGGRSRLSPNILQQPEKLRYIMKGPRSQQCCGSGLDPDSAGSLDPCIRILNPDPDPRGQKGPRKVENC
jgi:hypothetical protein